MQTNCLAGINKLMVWTEVQQKLKYTHLHKAFFFFITTSLSQKQPQQQKTYGYQLMWPILNIQEFQWNYLQIENWH